MNLMFRKGFREQKIAGTTKTTKSHVSRHTSKRCSREQGYTPIEEHHYRTHLFFSPPRCSYTVEADEPRCGPMTGTGGDPSPLQSSTISPAMAESDIIPQPLVIRSPSVSMMKWPSNPSPKTTPTRQVSFNYNKEAGQNVDTAKTLSSLDRDCFIIPVHSLDRFLPAGVPMPKPPTNGNTLERRTQGNLHVMEVPDPKLCVLCHLMSPLEPIDPVLESPLVQPLLKQRVTAGELLNEISQAKTAVTGMLLANMERNAEFPFISYYVINTSQTNPVMFYNNLRTASLTKFDPRSTRYTAAHTLDLYTEVASICRPPIHEIGVSLTKTHTSTTGYMISVYKVFEGDDREKFERNWLYWTGARMIYRYLPAGAGLRRISLHKSLSPKEMRLKKYIQQGAIIHKEKPFVFVLSSKVRTEYCDYCFKTGRLLKCSGCRYVYYCGKVCQKDGWNLHKFECRHLNQIAPRILPDSARFLVRLIRTLQKGGDLFKSYYLDNCFRMYKDLMSHYPNIKNDKKRMEHFTSLVGVLGEFLGDDAMPNSAELMGMYGRMCINSFNIMSPDLQCLGTGMYLGASVIDHSCTPNAVAIFEGTTLYIRALETFQYLDWSQISISYIDVLNVTKDRQDELQSLYYFLCQCPKCVTPESVEVRAIACPNTTCDMPIDPEIVQFGDKCMKCKTTITQEFFENYQSVLELTDLHLQNMKQLAYFDVCKVCLEKQDGVLHKFNIKRIKTLDLAFQSSIDFQKWDYARECALELVDAYHKYYGKFHPLTGLVHLKLGKILLFEENSKSAFDHLKIAYDILKITHGTSSVLYREELMPLLHQARVESC